jgi:hypothetical protein
MKRIVWIWLAQDASESDRSAWQQFVKVNMSISEDVRFLIAETESDLDFKADTLQKAGSVAHHSNWGVCYEGRNASTD